MEKKEKQKIKNQIILNVILITLLSVVTYYLFLQNDELNIKITDAKTGVSTFSKTLTGKGAKTFDALDYVPSEDAMEMAMDEVAAQLVAELTGQRFISPTESDAEYQDSPGKRLVE